MLSLAHNFLFVHIPKTAGNSIHRALLPFSEDRIVTMGAHQDGVERFEIRSPTIEMHKHLSLSEYRSRLGPSRFDPIFKFCTVRNPWDRCISFSFSPHRGKVEWSTDAFELFFEKTIQSTEHYLRLGRDDTDPFNNVDAVIRFEPLADDFLTICNRIGIGEIHLPKVNAGNHGDYRTYYKNPELIDRVAEKFRHDIARFSYTFE